MNADDVMAAEVMAANQAFYDAHEQRDLAAMTVWDNTVEGDLAWVTLDENLVDVAATGTIAATNLFVRTSSGWKLVLHHGSPVMFRG